MNIGKICINHSHIFRNVKPYFFNHICLPFCIDCRKKNCLHTEDMAVILISNIYGLLGNFKVETFFLTQQHQIQEVLHLISICLSQQTRIKLFHSQIRYNEELWLPKQMKNNLMCLAQLNVIDEVYIDKSNIFSIVTYFFDALESQSRRDGPFSYKEHACIALCRFQPVRKALSPEDGSELFIVDVLDYIVHSIDYQRMSEKNIIDNLYSQNLKLGNTINSLTDQNNFYKIQINNFNKLTNSINKDLYKLGINFQNKQVIEDSAKVAPLFIISNKIKLKNLQLKIGNSIRHTQKFKKNLEGSLPFIAKQIEEVEEEISILLAQYLQCKQENNLLKNINYGKSISEFYAKLEEEKLKYKQQQNMSMSELETKKKQTLKRLQFVKKEQKQRNRILCELISSNSILIEEVKNLKDTCPQNIEMNKQRAQQAKQLQDLQLQQKQLLNQIAIKSKELQQLYTTNKDYKQKIADKKYQENKQIKVLQEEILKCREQVREFKQKYRKIRVSGISKAKQLQKVSTGI